MTKTSWFLVAGVALGMLGCGSSVDGGGGTQAGSGGAGGTGASTTTATSSASSIATTTSGSPAGGGGSGGGLGDCEMEGGSAAATTGGSISCESDYACGAGSVSVECSSDGATSTCTCSLNGQVRGTCQGEFACSFPQSCCFELLGGHAEPNPGPYGVCSSSSSTATSSGSGGESMCSTTYDCEGGSLWIDCEGVPGQSATCECKDGQGFLLGSCQQAAVSCDYPSNCCYAIVN